MNQNLKTFIISLGSGVGFFFLFFLTDGFGFGKEIIREKYQILWILVGIFWIIGGFLRTSKDKNTKILKKIIIWCEIYLFLLIFIQPTITLSQGEFLILYLASTGLFHEFLTVRYQKRKKYFFTTCYGLIFLFMISIAIFIQWRIPIDEQAFINQQEYLLTTHFDGTLSSRYTKITLKSKIAREIPLQPYFQIFTLEKNTEYSITFSTQNKEDNNYLVLQDPSGNLFKIGSQSQVQFSTSGNILNLHQQEGNIEKFPLSIFPSSSELIHLQTLYKEDKKTFILNKLPSRFQKNQKIQKRSINYTYFLAKIFPFWYEENKETLQNYLPYLQLDTQHKNYGNIESSIIRETSKIGREKTSGFKKYGEYLSKFF